MQGEAAQSAGGVGGAAGGGGCGGWERAMKRCFAKVDEEGVSGG